MPRRYQQRWVLVQHLFFLFFGMLKNYSYSNLVMSQPIYVWKKNIYKKYLKFSNLSGCWHDEFSPTAHTPTKHAHNRIQPQHWRFYSEMRALWFRWNNRMDWIPFVFFFLLVRSQWALRKRLALCCIAKRPLTVDVRAHRSRSRT